MGISESDFLDMTPRQFYARRRGMIEQEKRETEIARISAYLISGPYLKKGTSLKKFWPLPWDEVPKFEKQDPAEMAAFRERASKRIKYEHAKRNNGNDSGT